MDNRETAVFESDLVENLAGAVRRMIVDNYKLQVYTFLSEDGSDRFFDSLLLVSGRNTRR